MYPKIKSRTNLTSRSEKLKRMKKYFEMNGKYNYQSTHSSYFVAFYPQI
jgi:hypothetical protein